MAVDTVHADVSYWASEWMKCRVAVAGERAVKDASEAYLPRLSGQNKTENNDADYVAYLRRAPFYNATGRTLDGLTGMLFRKKPVVVLPNAIADWSEDIDFGGTSIYDFADDIAEELFVTGWVGVMVDYPSDAGTVRSLADAQKSGRRPFLTLYSAEAILNWQFGRVNNKNVLTRVVVKEVVDLPDPEDEFKTIKQTRFRVLALIDGVYNQRVFVKADGRDKEIENTTPVKNGKPFTEIPFWLAAKTPIKPPLLDLVDVNLSHYRNGADLEHGAHYTGLPTAVITGHRLDDGGELRIGSGAAWIFPNENAKAFYLEFNGAGLSSLRDLMRDKENQMAALGARMLSPDKKAAETAETASIHRMGETSVLSSIANIVSELMTKALVLAADWGGYDGEASITLNTDFVPQSADPQLIAQLFAMLQGGRISYETFWAQLQKMEIADGQKKAEDEQSDIEADGPAPFQESATPPENEGDDDETGDEGEPKDHEGES